MRIDNKLFQDEFDKLPQLDRIEYRQKQESIQNKYNYNPGSSKYLLFIGVLLILDIFVVLRTGVWIKDEVITLLIALSLLGMLIEIYISVFLQIIGNKEIRKLINKYFNISVNVRKR